MATDEEFTARIKADTKEYNKGLDKAIKKTEQYRDAQGRLRAANGKFIKDSEKAGKGIGKLSDKFSKVAFNTIALNQATELLAKAYRGVSVAVNATIAPFAAYEKALVGVGKTTNISGQELQKFGNNIQKMSERIPVAANDLLGIAQSAGQLGVTGAANLENFAETIAKLGTASDLSGEMAATALTRIMNVTGTSIDQIDEVSSVIVELGNNFAATESEIARVANEVARSTAVFGITADESLALGASMRSLGIQAQLGGSVVGKALREIDNAIRGGGDAMVALTDLTGMTGEELQKTFKEDASAVFQSFIEGLGRVEKSGASVSTAMEIFNLKGDEVNKVLPVLAQRSDLVGKAFGLAAKEVKNATALNEEARKAFDTTASAMQLTRNVFTNLGSDIGSMLAPAFRGLLESMRELAPTIKSVATAILSIDFSGIFQTISQTSKVFAGVLIPAIIIFDKKLITIAKSLAIASIKFIAIGAAIGGVLVAIDLLVRNAGRMKDIFIAVINSIRLGFLKMGSFVIDMFSKMIKGLADGAARLASVFSDDLGNAIRSAGDAVSELNDKFQEASQDNADLLKDSIKGATEGLDLGIVGKLIDEGTKALDVFNTELKETEKTSKAIETSLSKGVPKSGGAVATKPPPPPVDPQVMRDLAKETANMQSSIAMIGLQGIPAIKKQAEIDRERLSMKREELKAQGKLTEAVENELRLQGQLIDQKEQAEITQAQAPAPAIDQGTIDMASGAFGDAVGGALGQFSGAITSAFTGPISAAQGVVDALQGMVDALPQLLFSIANLFNSITDLPMQIMEGFLAIFDSLENLVANFIPNIVNAVTGILEGFANFLAEGLPQAMEDLPVLLTDALLNLIDKLPDIAEKLVSGIIKLLVTSGPKLLIAINKMIPAIIKALVKAIPEVAKAMVDGLKEGLNEIANVFLGLTGNGLKQVGKTAEQGFKVMGEQLTGASSQLFEVIEGTAAARGQDTADKIRDAIASSTRSSGTFIEKIWKKLKDFVSNAWQWVLDKILTPLGKVVEKAWKWVVENILDPIAKVVEKAFKWVVDNILDPLANAVMKAFKWVVDNILEPMAKFVSDAWQFVLDFFNNIGELLKSAWNFIIEFFERIPTIIFEAFEFLIEFWKSLPETVLNAFSAVIEALSGIWDTLKENIFDPIVNALSSAFNFIKENIFDPITNALSSAFNFIKENIFDPITNALSGAFNFIKENIFDPITNALSSVFDTIKENIFDPITNALSGAFNTIKENVFDPIANALGGAFDKIQENVFDPIKKTLGSIFDFESLKTSFTSLFDNLNISSMFDLDTIKTNITTMLDKINPVNVLKKAFDFGSDDSGQGTVEKLLNIKVPFVSFAQGGMVPGTPTVQGDSPLNDKILSLLSPGEVVLSRSQVKEMKKMGVPGFFTGFSGEVKIGGELGKLGEFAKGGVKQFGKNLADLEEAFTETLKNVPDNIKSVLEEIGAAFQVLIDKLGIEGSINKIKEFVSKGLRRGIGGTLNREGLGGKAPSTFFDTEFGESLKAIESLSESMPQAGQAVITIPDQPATAEVVAALEKESKKLRDLDANKINSDRDFSIFPDDLEPRAFAKGGPVTGVDTVPSLLAPGEFIVSSGAAESIGLDALRQLNRTGKMGGGPVTSNVIEFQAGAFQIAVNAEQFDEEFVRTTLMDTIKEELREATNSGEQVVNSRGVF